jgi:hypothetical protein
VQPDSQPTSEPAPASDADAFWRRPIDPRPGSAPTTPAQGVTPPPPGYPGLAYPGPPPMTPPPSGWRPPRLTRAAEPRRLPAQNHARIDDEEARARTVTMGIGFVVGAIFLVTVCAICARALF